MRIATPLVSLCRVLATLSLVLLMAGPVPAEEYDPATGGPPPGSHQHFNRSQWELVPTADGAGITGKAVLDCYVDDLDELHISGKGFKSTGVYTVWLTKRDGPDVVTRAYVASGWEGKKADEYSFEARVDGQANYHGCIRTCPLGKWKSIEIRYHPRGNAKDLRTSVPVVRIPLKGQ